MSNNPLLKYTLFALALSISTTTLAQRNIIDSINGILPKAADTAKAKLYYRLAKEYAYISGDSGTQYANIAIEYARKYHQDKTEAESYGVIGTIEKNRGNYESALSYHLKAMNIKEKLKDEKGLATSYNDIGIVYKKMKRWDEALVYYTKSNQLAIKYDLKKAIANTYNNIGTIYLEKGRHDTAFTMYQKALAVAEQLGDPRVLATVLTNLADCYYNIGKAPEALAIFKRCLEYDKMNEDAYGIMMSYFHIATVTASLKDLDKAALYIDSADRIAVDQKMRRERVDITYIWSTIEERRHNLPKALELNRLSVNIKDSILNEDTQAQLSELQTKYETAKKEHEIKEQKAELARKNYIIAGGIGLGLFATLLAASYYRRRKLQQQSRLQEAIIHQQELATKAVIEAEERERKRIAGDLHDGVGQLMSAARLNLSVIASENPFPTGEQKLAFDKALALVDESCKEVRTVSHNIMPNALLKTGLTSAIREFIDKIDIRVLKVNLYTDGINERLPNNIETVLYRVIQECINNVIKHSGANHLDISVIKDEDGISVTIEDNGKGFDTSDKSKFDGIGLKNIQTRVEYLKGTVEWDSAVGKGTVVTINIPN